MNFERDKFAFGVTDEWFLGLDKSLRLQVEALQEKAYFQGRDEGLGYSLGERNTITKYVENKAVVLHSRAGTK